VFPYSGSKFKNIALLPAPPQGTVRITEPFAGSVSYSAWYRPPQVRLAESSAEVRGLLEYLATAATQDRLSSIEGTRPAEKIDYQDHAAQHGLCPAEATLVRLRCSGLMVGQLASRVLYPQHPLTFKRLRHALGWFQSACVAPIYRDYREVLPDGTKGDFWVIDPPYHKTNANYTKGSAFIDPDEFREWFYSLKGVSGIVTYGSDPEWLLPNEPWVNYRRSQTATARRGGTRVRMEHYLAFRR
jgi:hypothetical protein